MTTTVHRLVRDVMSPPAPAVREDTPFKEVARLLVERAPSALFVVDQSGRVVGVVSEADLLPKAQSGDERTLRGPLHPRGASRIDRRKGRAQTAGELMTSPAVTIGPASAISDAARLMRQRSLGQLPVVDARGIVIGLLTRRDVLRVYVRDDDDIRDEVIHDVLERTLWLDRTPVDVTVRDGVVTLCGRLERSALGSLAVELVRRVEGVVAVEDRLMYGINGPVCAVDRDVA